MILLNAINIRLILWSHCHCAAFSKCYLFCFTCSKIVLQLCHVALTASASHQQPALQTLTSIFLLYVLFVNIWNNKYNTVIICPPERWLNCNTQVWQQLQQLVLFDVLLLSKASFPPSSSQTWWTKEFLDNNCNDRNKPTAMNILRDTVFISIHTW